MNKCVLIGDSNSIYFGIDKQWHSLDRIEFCDPLVCETTKEFIDYEIMVPSDKIMTLDEFEVILTMLR